MTKVRLMLQKQHSNQHFSLSLKSPVPLSLVSSCLASQKTALLPSLLVVALVLIATNNSTNNYRVF